jgi:uncharacterized integral membrane protein
MRHLKLTFLFGATLLAIAALLQNTSGVQLQLLYFSFTIPKAILFAVFLLAGFILGVLVGQRFRKREK